MKNLLSTLHKIRVNKKGFTLIELLVVISILAILSVIGLSVFGGAQANARDGRRRSDIESIANAMEAKRGSDASTYSTLTAADFSSEAIPADPSRVYCATATTDSTAALLDNPSVWTGTTCTAGSPGTGQTSWAAVSTSSPVNNSYKWRVCASLESGTLFCRKNTQ